MPQCLRVVGPEKMELQYYEDPPVASHYVKFQTIYSAISHGSETMYYSGKAPKYSFTWDNDLRLFHSKEQDSRRWNVSLGYETVARVVELGFGVSDWKVGELVWLDRPHQETHVLDSRELPPHRRLNAEIDPKHATFYALLRVALGAIHDANPLLGENAIVVGLGTVGLLCVQLLKHAGIRQLTCIDPYADRRQMASNFGADDTFSADHNAAFAVKSSLSPIDFAIESSGTYQGLSTAIKCVSICGRVVVVSSYASQQHGLFLGHEFHRNRITIIPSMTVNGISHPRHPAWHLQRLNDLAMELLDEGKIVVEPLISRVVPFANAVEEFKRIHSEPIPPIKVLFSYE